MNNTAQQAAWSWETLRNQFAGTDDPKQMGTTGLVAWVVAGGPCCISRDWNRLQRATAIIRKRHGKNGDKAVAAFCAAVWNVVGPNRWARRRLARQLAAFGYEAQD